MKFHRYLTIGRYAPGSSLLHRADPRGKLLLALGFAVAVFLTPSWPGLGALALLVAAATACARVSPLLLVANWRGMWLVFLMTLLLSINGNLGDEGGRIIIGSADTLYLTQAGILHGLRLCAQLALAVVGFALFTATTTVLELGTALERLLAPAARLGFPAADFAMMLALAVRFFPVLTEETETVIRAQAARGAPLGTGGPLARLGAIAAVIVPVFMRTFRHAGDMAVAMECRLYGSTAQRTLLRPLAWRGFDSLLCLAGVVLLVGCVRL